jgi:pyocin large subunit-like protein
MSFDALAWAGRCNPGSPALKLVLLGLAECAHRDTCKAWPSIAALSEFTCLNRKTIIAALDTLCARNFISETGEKQGKTGQVKVYFLHLETVPKTEQSQKRNSSTFSVKQSQKRDTEPVREPVSLDGKPSKGSYAFSGLVIRLSKPDFNRWQKAFPDLDLTALLQSRDDWLRDQPEAAQRRWFQSTSSWLAKKQSDESKAAKTGSGFSDEYWTV